MIITRSHRYDVDSAWSDKEEDHNGDFRKVDLVERGERKSFSSRAINFLEISKFESFKPKRMGLVFDAS